MYTFLKKILDACRMTFGYAKTLFLRFARTYPVRTLLGVTAVLVALYAGALFAFSNGESAEKENERLPEVSLISVYDLRATLPPLSLIGTVRSETEATALAEASGQITRIAVTLGSSVSAGTIIAEIENAVARAQVLQAEGALAGAEAGLQKTSGATREEQLAILETNKNSAENSLRNAHDTARNTLLSAYASIDDALRQKTDVMFNDPTGNARVILLIPDATLVGTLEASRRTLESIRKKQQTQSLQLSETKDMLPLLTEGNADLRQVREYLDLVIEALGKAIGTSDHPQATIETYRAQAIAARTSITGSMSNITGSEEQILSRKGALNVALKNLEQGVTGGSPEDVLSSRAALLSAQAGLRSAQAMLEKTIVRAPFPGTINALHVNLGEFVSVTAPVATIANNNILEIRTSVTEQDARYIETGAIVSINDQPVGRIIRIAPALDPLTKKIEVRIAINDASGGITNGQSVRITIPRKNYEVDEFTESSITIPLTALKFTPNGPVIFTVENDTLVEHPVVPGTLLGDTVRILSGISSDMSIVIDARGKKSGDRITIASPSL